MRKFSFSPLTFCASGIGALFVVYMALIAVVMSYASLTIEFSQSIKNDESRVASLEAQYLASVAEITATNYANEGYATPLARYYVPAAAVTALR